MPELPEVETVSRGLARLLVGKIITDVQLVWAKSFPLVDQDRQRHLLGSEIVSVSRRAKLILIDLSSHYSLVIHLKMTGQLVFRGHNVRFGAGHPSDSLIGNLPDKSTRVIFEFSDSSKLFFNDQRKFGWLKLLPTREVGELDFFKKLGPEPLAVDFSWQEMKRCLERRKRSPIKVALIDQTVIAGVGNIYADESLWSAKIHPKTLVDQLSDYHIKQLHKSLRAILRLSIRKGGSTDRNYVNAEGKKGGYLVFAKVFRRSGQNCPRCGGVIIKIRLGGRGTHLCPVCQKQSLL
ncbi:MAG TPA: bifunctional DNA-formamidopyrimidine glycosylase/DNA-(apurinic or apyrimidinic site) lyase [Candidatus Dormibacteraeota bacterium]|nr:bifunctional DNA-formamidopyrimidine glycosylase/DNA-(apurinic or apyrimidinic site) lyase [Candidatus Dormibacteraeota bacterium]